LLHAVAVICGHKTKTKTESGAERRDSFDIQPAEINKFSQTQRSAEIFELLIEFVAASSSN
jgi:hypothetical protein